MKRDDLYLMRKSAGNVEQLREQIVDLETKRISPRATVYGSERVQTSVRDDIIPRQIHAIDKLLERYRAELDAHLKRREEFEDTIKDLPPLHKEIMRYYFVDALTWEQVWQKTNYSVRHLRRITKTILDDLFPEDAREKAQKSSTGKTCP